MNHAFVGKEVSFSGEIPPQSPNGNFLGFKWRHFLAEA